MDSSKEDSLLVENHELKKALQSTKRLLDRTMNDYDTIKKIHEDFKVQFERVRKENETLLYKNSMLTTEKNQLEKVHENAIRDFRNELEDKKKEIEELRNYTYSKQDPAAERIKILHEMEQPFKLALESKDQEIEKLKDVIYDHKRQIDLLNAKYESIRLEAESDIKTLKSRHQQELNDLMVEIDSLQKQVEEGNLHSGDRSYRKLYEDLRLKYEKTERELNEVTRQRDRFREEKHEILLKFTKQIEAERAEKQEAYARFDELVKRTEEKDSETNRLNKNILIQEQELKKITTEFQRLQRDNEQKTRQIEELQRHVEEPRLSSTQRRAVPEALMRPSVTAGEERRAVSLQKENDQLKNRIFELESNMLSQKNHYEQELMVLQGKYIQAESEKQIDQKKIAFLEEQIQILKADNQRLDTELQNAIKNAQNFAATRPVERERFSEYAPQRTGYQVQSSGPKDEVMAKKNQKLKEKLKRANEKILQLLHEKKATQNLPNAFDIVRKYQERSPVKAVQSDEPSYTSQEHLIRRLQEKYGVTNTIRRDGGGGSVVQTEDENYRQYIQNIVEKYK